MISLETVQIVKIEASSASKMPWLSWDISARKCITGSKLRSVAGSVCSDCYACTGSYNFPVVKNANQRRFSQLSDLSSWEKSFISFLRKKISHYSCTPEKRFFRWFTSGDLQSVEMLEAIVNIAKAIPEIRFWLPTKEHSMVRKWQSIHGEFPSNLTVRLSMYMVDQTPIKSTDLPTSTVISSESKLSDASHGTMCHATKKEGDHECGDCRNCWNSSVKNVAYLLH